MDSEAILDFVDAGHDLILAADSKASDEIRNLASDLGVDLEPQGSTILDTTNHVALSKAVDATLITSRQILQSPAIFGEKLISVSNCKLFVSHSLLQTMLLHKSNLAYKEFNKHIVRLRAHDTADLQSLDGALQYQIYDR